MNSKKKRSSQNLLLISGSSLAILAAVGIGYLIGKKTDPPAINANAGTQSETQPKDSNALSSEAPSSAAAKKKELTSADLARVKNVPAILSDPGGDYQIVAVIEGGEANRKLTSGLQVIGAQRQRLLGLSRQYDQTPAASIQQRELIAGEILKSRNILSRNLQFMTQQYAYSLEFNYRLVPHAASLFLISTGEDGNPSSKKIHEFTDATSYESFQKMRDEYLLLGVKESDQNVPPHPVEDAASAPEEEGQPASEAGTVVTQAEGADRQATEAPSDPSPSAEPSEDEDGSAGVEDPTEPNEIALTAEMTALRQRMIQDYSYDPLTNHQINFTKTALYARRGNR